MTKRYDLRRIKKHYTYTVTELADETSVTKLTVRRWLVDGMTAIDAQRPTLIIGEAAIEFLKDRQSKAKQPMKLFELYCLACKKPSTPFGMLADYTPQSPSGGRLSALCDVCGRECYRNVSASQIPQLREYLDIVIRGAE